MSARNRPDGTNITMNNEIRNNLQAEAVEALLKQKRLIVNWGTGVGKSRVAVQAATRLYDTGLTRILLLVAETAHKANWAAEFAEMGNHSEDVFGKMTVECYASLKKYQYTQWDLIIADEAHHLRSENRIGLLSSLKGEFVLCLSATLSEKNDGKPLLQALESTFGQFEQRSFTLQQSIDAKVLGEPRIYVHVLTLRNGVQNQQVTLTRGFPKARKKICCTYEQAGTYLNDLDRYPNLELMVSCSPKQGYALLTQEVKKAKAEYMDLYNQSRDIFASTVSERDLESKHNAWMLLGSKRKLFLGRCKTEFAKWLIRQIGEQKFICFCSDVQQGIDLGGDRIVNSKRRDNTDVIRAFNEGETRSLFAVGMLQEGVSLHGIEVGICLQLGGKERVFIQKFGRAMRAENPIQHIVIFNNTHDVDYFRTAVENIDKRFIKYRRYTDDDNLPWQS